MSLAQILQNLDLYAHAAVMVFEVDGGLSCCNTPTVTWDLAIFLLPHGWVPRSFSCLIYDKLMAVDINIRHTVIPVEYDF